MMTMVSNYVPWFIKNGGTQAIGGLPSRIGDDPPLIRWTIGINADELGGVKWW